MIESNYDHKKQKNNERTNLLVDVLDEDLDSRPMMCRLLPLLSLSHVLLAHSLQQRLQHFDLTY